MSNTWGVDLWDQREIIEKHTNNGIEFLERCASFVKERIRIEHDYAKSLRRLVKQYQFKKKIEDDLPYTYQHAFKQFLQETDDFAGQREVIAEETKNNILVDMHKVASDSKNERKKALTTLNDLKSKLEQLHKALQNAKSKYEKASEDSNTAYKNYESASQSLDITKAQILKFQKTSQDKKVAMDRCKDDYLDVLDNFNKTQKLYYESDFPKVVLNELQIPEENRVKKLSGYFKEMSNIMGKVQPIIKACLDGMVKAGDSCDPGKDSSVLIDRHRTGEFPPGDVAFEEWGKAITASNNSLAPSPAVNRIKSKQHKNAKKKEVDPSIANDHADLPPAQRKKRFNKAIHQLKDQISHKEKEKAAIVKMQGTTSAFGGDQNTMQNQLVQIDKDIQHLSSLLQQYECYLAALDDNGKSNSRPVSTVSTENFPAPPPNNQPEQSAPAVGGGNIPPPPPPPGGDFPNDEFDDELRCNVLYDFGGSNDGEMSVYAGEELIIVEEDDGSGWTRVLRGDEEGYIPTSYVQKI